MKYYIDIHEITVGTPRIEIANNDSAMYTLYLTIFGVFSADIMAHLVVGSSLAIKIEDTGNYRGTYTGTLKEVNVQTGFSKIMVIDALFTYEDLSA